VSKDSIATLVELLMLESGIVPLSAGDIYPKIVDASWSIDKRFSSISKEEKRKMKRKFRKLWRKKAKSSGRDFSKLSRTTKRQLVRSLFLDMAKESFFD